MPFRTLVMQSQMRYTYHAGLKVKENVQVKVANIPEAKDVNRTLPDDELIDAIRKYFL